MTLRLLVVTLSLLATMSGFAQRGRGFVSVEGHVGLARIVHVGTIESLKQIEYNKPLQFPLSAGKPYRLLFKVGETIRGPKTKTLELVLDLQRSTDLEFFRDHHTELMLVGGPSMQDEEAVDGLEEQGKAVESTRYSFRILRRLEESNPKDTQTIEWQINTNLDSGRMFGSDLSVVSSRDGILKRARAFAKKHAEILSSIWLIVPNEFGSLCGYTNAYCGITLPICPETEHTLASLLKNPDRFLRGVKAKDRDNARWSLLVGTLRVFEPFPSRENAALVRRLSKGYEPKPLQDGRFASPYDVKRAADKLLETWKM